MIDVLPSMWPRVDHRWAGRGWGRRVSSRFSCWFQDTTNTDSKIIRWHVDICTLQYWDIMEYSHFRFDSLNDGLDEVYPRHSRSILTHGIITKHLLPNISARMNCQRLRSNWPLERVLIYISAGLPIGFFMVSHGFPLMENTWNTL